MKCSQCQTLLEGYGLDLLSDMERFAVRRHLHECPQCAAKAAAIATLIGYRLEGRRGDALIMQAIEPSERLDVYLARTRLSGSEHRAIERQIRRMAHEMGKASLGHAALGPEQMLIRALLRLPEVVAQSARELAPHHLAYYAQELAAVFHSFYRDCRVVSSLPEDRDITLARLKLVDAARIVLARTLQLMGMTAPETM